MEKEKTLRHQLAKKENFGFLGADEKKG